MIIGVSEDPNHLIVNRIFTSNKFFQAPHLAATGSTLRERSGSSKGAHSLHPKTQGTLLEPATGNPKNIVGI